MSFREEEAFCIQFQAYKGLLDGSITVLSYIHVPYRGNVPRHITAKRNIGIVMDTPKSAHMRMFCALSHLSKSGAAAATSSKIEASS